MKLAAIFLSIVLTIVITHQCVAVNDQEIEIRFFRKIFRLFPKDIKSIPHVVVKKETKNSRNNEQGIQISPILPAQDMKKAFQCHYKNKTGVYKVPCIHLQKTVN